MNAGRRNKDCLDERELPFVRFAAAILKRHGEYRDYEIEEARMVYLLKSFDRDSAQPDRRERQRQREGVAPAKAESMVLIQKEELEALRREQERVRERLEGGTLRKEIAKEVLRSLQQEWRLAKLRHGR